MTTPLLLAEFYGLPPTPSFTPFRAFLMTDPHPLFDHCPTSVLSHSLWQFPSLTLTLLRFWTATPIRSPNISFANYPFFAFIFWCLFAYQTFLFMLTFISISPTVFIFQTIVLKITEQYTRYCSHLRNKCMFTAPASQYGTYWDHRCWLPTNLDSGPLNLAKEGQWKFGAGAIQNRKLLLQDGDLLICPFLFSFPIWQSKRKERWQFFEK